MSAATANAAPAARTSSLAWAARQRVMIALILLIAFGALRYDHFLGAYNVLSVLRYNSMFALTSLGMGFVIMGAGIDLSVGTTAAFASVVSALLSPYGLVPGLLGGLSAGLAVGAVNGFMVTRMNIQPFIATLSGMLAASGCGLLLAHNQSVSVSYDTGFTWLGQGDLLGFPVPAWIAAAAYVYGSVVLNFTSFGRHVLSVGGNEEAARLMGLAVDRVKFSTYVQSGVFAGLAGVILAAQFGAGQPAEGVGWELFSIAAVVVGGHAAHRRHGLGGDDARRRAPARPHLQCAQFRERPRLDQPQRLLAVGGARRVPDGGGDGEFRRGAPRHPGGLALLRDWPCARRGLTKPSTENGPAPPNESASRPAT